MTTQSRRILTIVVLAMVWVWHGHARLLAVPTCAGYCSSSTSCSSECFDDMTQLVTCVDYGICDLQAASCEGACSEYSSFYDACYNESQWITCGDYGVFSSACECGDGLCNSWSSCGENCQSCPDDCAGICGQSGDDDWCGQCTDDSECNGGRCNLYGCCVSRPPRPPHPFCWDTSECDAGGGMICRDHACVSSGSRFCLSDGECGAGWMCDAYHYCKQRR
jgi:hypothetical protein